VGHLVTDNGGEVEYKIKKSNKLEDYADINFMEQKVK